MIIFRILNVSSKTSSEVLLVMSLSRAVSTKNLKVNLRLERNPWYNSFNGFEKKREKDFEIMPLRFKLE